MKLAIMQPYVFPYLGYFQLINSVDEFVFYDDVNYIKRGWVNRNKVLINNSEKLITFPCIKASQNKLINEVKISIQSKEFLKLEKTILEAYKKAPYYKQVKPILQEVFHSEAKNIGEYAMNSVKIVSEYLNIYTKFKVSSKHFSESKGMEKSKRLISICKKSNANVYINSEGGKMLYDKKVFKEEDIDLYFIKSVLSKYKQFSPVFISGLSIIDIMMFNSVLEINEMLNQYILE